MLIYAKQPIYYLLQYHPQKIRTLYLAKEIEKKEYTRLVNMGINIKRIPNEAAVKMARGASHQGFLAEVDDIVLQDYREFLKFDFVLVLAGLTDIGNIGSLVRTGYALGVDAIVATGVSKLSLEGIARVSTGALFDMPFSTTKNIHDLLNDLKTSGFTIYGADMGGEDVRYIKPPKKRALVLGSEGEGLPKRVAGKLDKVVSIEMEHAFDSLNVAVAGAILIDRMRDE
ncbi:23S rRNA (guanosine-2'-O-)-methyltransferase rlmB [hydrothermal vent metagenome]|uniref:23S rRNA (Guanosine-2'-O-)-methyltransferase rlmB n=1 Tax=hydrothermal vent metagenome TaxID=652676 RepID=A0A1W1B8V0_9ZZZZ